LILQSKIRKENYYQGAREISLDLLSTCLHFMEFRFYAMLCSNFGNEYSDAGHIECTHCPQVPYPCHRRISAKYWNELRWAFPFYCIAIGYCYV